MFKRYIIIPFIMLFLCAGCGTTSENFERPTEPIPKITNNFEKEPILKKPKKEKSNIYNSKPLKIELSGNLLKLTETIPTFKDNFKIWKALDRIFINDHPVAQMTLIYSHLNFLADSVATSYTIIVSLDYKGKTYILNGRSFTFVELAPSRATKIAIDEALMQIYVQAKYIISD